MIRYKILDRLISASAYSDDDQTELNAVRKDLAALGHDKKAELLQYTRDRISGWEKNGTARAMAELWKWVETEIQNALA